MTRTVLASLALVLVGCSSAGTPDAPLAIYLDGSTLILDVPPNDHRKVQTCDLFSGVDKQTKSGWVPLVDDLPGDLYQRSTFTGYMLDGAFVPPSTFAGCDLVECVDLATYTGPLDVGVAVEYVATGSTAPPVDYTYADPFTKPASIQVFESHPLHGVRVRSHVNVYRDAACRDRQEEVLEIQVP